MRNGVTARLQDPCVQEWNAKRGAMCLLVAFERIWEFSKGTLENPRRTWDGWLVGCSSLTVTTPRVLQDGRGFLSKSAMRPRYDKSFTPGGAWTINLPLWRVSWMGHTGDRRQPSAHKAPELPRTSLVGSARLWAESLASDSESAGSSFKRAAILEPHLLLSCFTKPSEDVRGTESPEPQRRLLLNTTFAIPFSDSSSTARYRGTELRLSCV